MASANDAAVALAEHVAGSVPAFVQLMNRWARSLGLDHTAFRDPTGLDDRGVSSASDVAALSRAVLGHPFLAHVVRTREHRFPGPGGVREVANRNVLLWLYPGAIGVKTGFTSAAGYTLAAAADRGGTRLLAVILGNPGPPFGRGAALLDYGFGAFRRAVLATRGEPLGEVAVGGQPVPVRAGRDLARLVRRSPPARVERVLIPVGGLSLPVGEGEVVARLVVRVDNRPAGSVPAVAAATVTAGPPALQEAARAVLQVLGTVARLLARAFL
jgi:D-alanyl-D-alanine carboxypeptidase (penicillin-binding protein 5/6)